MSRSTTAAICCVLGGCLLLFGNTAGPIDSATDVLSQCYKADRASKARLLREWATIEGSDDQRGDWWNEQQDEATQEDFGPWLDLLAEAAGTGTETELADKLEAGQ